MDPPDFNSMYRGRWPEASRDVSYRWHPLNPVAVAYRHQRERAVVAALATAPALPSSEVLDVGCGTGANLRYLVECGASPARIHGVDIIPERVAVARERNPSIDLRVADAAELPFPDASMDLVTQFVAFSSMPARREEAAAEIARVVRPGGAVLWYDVLRPAPGRIPDGIPLKDVRALFEPFELISARNVHPPFTARLAGHPVLLGVAELLPPPLRTNVVAVLRRRA